MFGIHQLVNEFIISAGILLGQFYRDIGNIAAEVQANNRVFRTVPIIRLLVFL